MARKRMIDPDFWTDEKLGCLKRDERLFFMGLISNADDEGRGRANIKLLKSAIFPYDDDIKVKDVEIMLQNISRLNLVFIYKADGQDFYYLPNFLKHQNINRPTASKLPEFNSNNDVLSISEQSVKEHGAINEDSSPIEVNIKEDNINVGEVNLIFDKLWLLYPKKDGKAQVSKTQKQKLYKIGYDEMARAIQRYKEAKEGTEYKYLKMGSTFFNSGYVDYLDANYEEPKGYGVMLPGGGFML